MGSGVEQLDLLLEPEVREMWDRSAERDRLGADADVGVGAATIAAVGSVLGEEGMDTDAVAEDTVFKAPSGKRKMKWAKPVSYLPWWSEMDAPSKLFFGLEQKNGQKRFMHAVRTESGDLLSEPAEIRKWTVSFFSKLNNSEQSGAHELEESFLHKSPKLTRRSAEALDRALSLDELYTALLDPLANLADVQAMLVDFFRDAYTGYHRGFFTCLRMRMDKDWSIWPAGLLSFDCSSLKDCSLALKVLCGGYRSAEYCRLWRDTDWTGPCFYWTLGLWTLGDCRCFIRDYLIYGSFLSYTESCSFPYWLLEEPLVHGARLDISSQTSHDLSRILIAAGLTELGQLVGLAGPQLTNGENFAAQLGMRSIRVARQLLYKWSSALTSDERPQESAQDQQRGTHSPSSPSRQTWVTVEARS
ncbi:hypothetical protein NFI96_028700 [Prochilodus magdalenae]|nr:hypothetical protein NFI96_028700 [Prochilodus magdalenae]